MSIGKKIPQNDRTSIQTALQERATYVKENNGQITIDALNSSMNDADERQIECIKSVSNLIHENQQLVHVCSPNGRAKQHLGFKVMDGPDPDRVYWVHVVAGQCGGCINLGIETAGDYVPCVYGLFDVLIVVFDEEIVGGQPERWNLFALFNMSDENKSDLCFKTLLTNRNHEYLLGSLPNAIAGKEDNNLDLTPEEEKELDKLLRTKDYIDYKEGGGGKWSFKKPEGQFRRRRCNPPL